MHRAIATAAAAAALLAPTAQAQATPWARISGPTQPGVQLGLARTADGVLHIIWNRGATPTTILETKLSAANKLSPATTVASNWNGNDGLALLTMPDGSLRLFVAGGTYPGSPIDGIETFT